MMLTRKKPTEKRIEQMRRNSQAELDAFETMELNGATLDTEEQNRRYKAWKRNRKAYRLGHKFNDERQKAYLADLIKQQDKESA